MKERSLLYIIFSINSNNLYNINIIAILPTIQSFMNFIFLVSNFSTNRKRVVDDSFTIIYIVRERRKRFCHTLYRNIFQLSSHWAVFCCESWESSTVSMAFGQGPLMERRNYRAFGILTNA